MTLPRITELLRYGSFGPRDEDYPTGEAGGQDSRSNANRDQGRYGRSGKSESQNVIVVPLEAFFLYLTLATRVPDRPADSGSYPLIALQNRTVCNRPLNGHGELLRSKM
jgi:hypothetical protein